MTCHNCGFESDDEKDFAHKLINFRAESVEEYYCGYTCLLQAVEDGEKDNPNA